MSTSFLLSTLLLAAAAATSKSLTVSPGCQASCGGVDIPYPFGIGIGSGCSRKGFEIDCINNGPVLAGTSFQVVRLSVDPAQLLVVLPVGFKCYNASSPGEYEDSSYGETLINKEGVYRISNTHNMVVVLGCNTFAQAASTKTEGTNYPYTYYTGCMSYCNNSASAKDGECAGVGCCHVDIPPGLTDNFFKFTTYDHSGMMDYSPCDYGFIVDRTSYTFKRSDLFRDPNRTSLVWLDWAIRGNSSVSSDILSCTEAAKTTTPKYACVSDYSKCVDTTNGPGYNCSCSDGYEGNAYVVDGCTDIKECANSTKYPCKGNCENTEGSYRCTCPSGYRSDDARIIPCTRKFPLVAQICIGNLRKLTSQCVDFANYYLFPKFYPFSIV